MENVAVGRSTRRRLEINNEEAEVVQRVFDLYGNEKLGGTSIASKLNSLGYRTRWSPPWTKRGVFKILNNKIYTGCLVC